MGKPKKKLIRESVPKDDYWMGLAFVVAAASRSSGRCQGAVILSANHDFYSLGCESPPKQSQECEHFIHAEMQALHAAKFPLAGGLIYLTHTPCYDCLCNVVAAGIKRVVYYPSRAADELTTDLAKTSYIQFEEFAGNLNWLRDYLKVLEGNGIFS